MFKAISKVFLATILTFTLTCSTLANSAYAGVTYDAPSNSSFKSYMDYRSITNKSSAQWAIQANSVTDAEGLRKYNDCFTVAIGTGWGAPVGTYFDAELSTGVVLHCVVGDHKAPQHTINGHRQAPNGNVIEFIVDTHTLLAEAKRRGDVSFTSGKAGYVKSITIRDGKPIENVTAEEAAHAVAQQAIETPEVVDKIDTKIAETKEAITPCVPAEDSSTVLLTKEPVLTKVEFEVKSSDTAANVTYSSNNVAVTDDDEFLEESQEGTYDDSEEFIDASQEGIYYAESQEGEYRDPDIYYADSTLQTLHELVTDITDK